MVATAQIAKNKKNGGKPAGRINMIGGFSVDRLSGAFMRAFIDDNEEVKAAVGDVSDMNDEQIAVALTEHFGKTTAKANVVSCDYCLGLSSDQFPVCPYCGTSDDELESAASSETVPAPIATPIAAAPKLDDDVPVAQATSPVQDVPSSPKVTKIKKTITTTVKKPSINTNGDEAQMQTEHVNGSNGQKLTKVERKSTKLTVDTLDKAVQDVERLKSAAAGSYWQLGRKILEVYDTQLWKLRQSEEGKARYKGFDAFCHHEFKMSPTHAYKLMDVAKKFSEKDVAQFGTTKLGLLLQAPPEDQPAIEKQVRAGASTKKVKEAVAGARKQKGFKKPSGKGRKQETKTTGRAAEKITVASIEGRKTVKLFAKPANMRNIDFASLKRAKKLGDIPFGRLELANDVVMYISVQDHNGELVAVVDTRRETASASDE